MTDSSHRTLERISRRVPVPQPAYDRLLRRRDRKVQNRRVSAAVLAIVIALLSVAAIVRAFGNSGSPADEPTPTPVDTGIFSGIGGWIVYGGIDGIWAMDPERPGSFKHLSTHVGEPLAWSIDGSRLLILRQSGLGQSGHALFVLHADGTETLVADVGRQYISGSISPDGSTVVYATGSDSDHWIYVVDAGGGTPRRLHEASVALPPAWMAGLRFEVSWPVFSPDGSQIAYFQGGGDHDNSLWVMKADGSGAHALLKSVGVMRDSAGLRYLGWSPDGRRLAFEMGYGPYRIYTVGADGSGLTRVIPNGIDPFWSPDGSHISYTKTVGASASGPLVMANADGTHVRGLSDLVSSGPWNPLTRAGPAIQGTSGTTGAAHAHPLGYAIAALAAVGIVVLWRGRKRKEEDVR